MMHRLRSIWHFAIVALSGFWLSEGLSSSARGAAYASGVSINGTTVSFILNEPADQLSITLNGTSTISLDGSTSGVKTFNLGSTSDTFAITASTNDPVGYTIPTGGTIAPVATGLSQASSAGGFMLISDDTNPLVRFNSPRGVTVATDPNNSQFGTAYISNSAAGTTSGVVRAVGDGLYRIQGRPKRTHSETAILPSPPALRGLPPPVARSASASGPITTFTSRIFRMPMVESIG